MTYLLVCALCAGTPGPIAFPAATPSDPALGLEPGRDAPSLGWDPPASELGLARAAPLSLADQPGGDDHSGHDDGAHVGPMWIMMGVMMAGMMVAFGAYMMRGHWVTTSFQPGAPSPPHLAAIPPQVGLRPGG